jgi:hypothetical protein
VSAGKEVTEMNSGLRARLNQLDRVERSQNRAPDTVTEMNFGLRARLNQLDRVERSQNRAPDTVTEMNFGLRFADQAGFARDE